MRKPDSLRQAIVVCAPDLGRDADRLMLWIDKGGVTCSQNENLSYTRDYRLNILISDFTADPAIIEIAILSWLQIHQPQLLSITERAFEFEVDILDNKSSDIQIMLELSETILVAKRDDSGFELTTIDEPDWLADDMLGFGQIAPVPSLSEIWLANGEKLLPDVPPLGADVQPIGSFPP